MQKEIITLQFGHYSNFVGSHFWSIQDEDLIKDKANEHTDKNVLFRESSTSTLKTPRLILFDKRGSLGSLSAESGIAGISRSRAPSHNTKDLNPLWSGNVTTYNSDPIENKFSEVLEKKRQQTQYQNYQTDVNPQLESQSVTLWSDFLSTQLHPKSICELNNVVHEIDAFDHWTDGSLVYSDLTQREEMFERFRYFSEECDTLQGIQVFSDFETGFGGLTKEFLADVKDEYPKSPVVTFGVSPWDKLADISKPDFENYIINSILSLYTFCYDDAKISDMFVPILTRYWQQKQSPCLMYDIKNSYHTSAITAAAIDTITLPTRSAQAPIDMTSLFNGKLMGHFPQLKIASLSFGFPLPLPQLVSEKQSDLLTVPWNLDLSLMKERSVEKGKKVNPYSESVVIRGIKSSKISSELKNLDLSLCSSTYEKIVKSQLALPIGFPSIFTEAVGVNGRIQDESRKGVVSSVPVVGHMQLTSALHGQLAHLLNEFVAIDKKKFSSFTKGVINSDEWEEMKSRMYTIVDNYEPYY